MNFKLQTNIELATLTTMKIGGKAKYFTELSDANMLPEVFAWLKEKKLPHIILSGGSNTVFDDGTFDGLVIKIEIKGFNIVEEINESVLIQVGSGENWDETVRRSIDLNLSGIEALSGIPGNCGAAPVQNIGAYGQEVRQTLEKVDAFDCIENKMISLNNSECKFAYRDSVFKTEQKGRYIISAIYLRLTKNSPKMPDYKDIQEFFHKSGNSNPSLKEIRSAVIDIRSNKFADPDDVPNSGSFFKNPIISSDLANQLKREFPDIKMFDLNNGKYKLFAGWLIEQAGLKGKQLEHVRIDPNHALVLENTGDATQGELKQLVSQIQAEVKNKFGITLEPEPVIVKF